MSKQVITSKGINNSEFCLRNAFFARLEFYEGKNKYSYLNKIVESFFKEFDFNTQKISDALTLFNKLIKEIPLKIGIFEETEEVEQLKKQLFRYVNFRLKKGCTQLNKGKRVKVYVDGIEIEVSIDAVFSSVIGEEKVVEVVKYFRSGPKLTMQKSKNGNSTMNSTELYLMQLAGESLYPKKKVVPVYHHMKSKKDNSKSFSGDYAERDNYLYYCFNEDDADSIIIKNEVESTIVEHCNSEVSITSPKCDKNCKECKFNLICNYEKPEPSKFNEIEEETVIAPKASYSFNKGQIRAINFNKGVLKINAGAGSGKTTLLAGRVSRLLKDGALPEEILLTTFTNKGAEEIREKIIARLIEDGVSVDVDKLKIYTFNGLGDLIIKEYFESLGFESEPLLADKVDKYDIIYSLLKEIEGVDGLDYRNPLMSLPRAKGAVVILDMLINKYSSKSYTSAKEFSDDVNEDGNLSWLVKMTEERAQQFISFFYTFKDEFIEKNFIQYQDQMGYMLELFQDKNILNKYAVKHIMIDEMQDTDGIQMQLIKKLYKHYKTESLVVVGDDSQSIFGFRNVTSENIINFEKDFPETESIFLIDNYRSTPEIINTANMLNAYNIKRIDKDLISRKPSGKSPELIKANTKEREYEYISEKIKALIGSGRNPSEIAVIALSRNELKKIQGYLTEEGVASVMHTPVRLYEHIHVKMVASLGTFLYKPVNDVKLLEFINAFHRADLEKMGEKEMLQFFMKKKAEIYLKFRNTKSDEKKKNLFFSMVKPFAEDSLEVESFLEQLRRRPGSFDSLMKYLHDFMLYEGDQSVNPSKKKYEAVVLITAHSSKGKEYPIVFNTLNKYHFNSKMTSVIEEARRLAFVSITRAKEELYLSYNSKDTKHNRYETELHGVTRLELA